MRERAAPLRLDHATVTGPRLGPLMEAFAAAGLPAEYGGVHEGRPTHMALIPFPDGTYIELLSELEPPGHGTAEFRRLAEYLQKASGTKEPTGREGTTGPAGWGRAGGFSDWAVGVDDIEGEMRRLGSKGFGVSLPVPGGRRRPDGALVRWIVSRAVPASLGSGGNVKLSVDLVLLLPFSIQDVTARELRVRPPALPPGGDAELLGIGAVVLAVRSIARAMTLLQRAYDLELPVEGESEALDADLAAFPGAPVALAAPRGPASPLARHIESQGESLCAILIETRNLGAAARRLALGAPESWCGRQAAWIDPGLLLGHRIGCLG